MYSDWGINAIVVAATVAVVSLCVLLHYEALLWLSSHLKRLAGRRRRRVLVGVYALVLIHVLEIWLFGLALYSLAALPGAGSIVGQPSVGLLDAVYLSAVSYTTVGFGDLAPLGPLRFLIGTESLLGLLLIGWSASFTYIEMEAFWRTR
jgi:hypothetical protein